jgi:hypothetical protein
LIIIRNHFENGNPFDTHGRVKKSYADHGIIEVIQPEGPSPKEGNLVQPKNNCPKAVCTKTDFNHYCPENILSY